MPLALIGSSLPTKRTLALLSTDLRLKSAGVRFASVILQSLILVCTIALQQAGRNAILEAVSLAARTGDLEPLIDVLDKWRDKQIDGKVRCKFCLRCFA